MKRISTVFACLCFAIPAAASSLCPAPPDTNVQKAEILNELATAPTDFEAARLTARMFQEVWTRAPNARAQELLDGGMERREIYDFAQAARLLDELIAYCPNYAEGYNQRAFVAFLRGNYALAVPLLERALQLSPDHYAARSGLGLTLLNLGKFEAAQRELKEALKLNPMMPERGYIIDTHQQDDGEEI